MQGCAIVVTVTLPAPFRCAAGGTAPPSSRLCTHCANARACRHHYPPLQPPPVSSPRYARMGLVQVEVVRPGGRGRAGRGGGVALVYPGLARVQRGGGAGERWWLRWCNLSGRGRAGAHARWGVAQTAEAGRGWTGAGGTVPPMPPGLRKGEGAQGGAGVSQSRTPLLQHKRGVRASSRSHVPPFLCRSAALAARSHTTEGRV